MNKVKFFIAATLIILFNIPGQSQSRKFVNEFLNIGVGARPLAMFGAVTAKTADVNSGYWNPAGLLNIQAPFQVSAMHSEWFAGIAQYDYLGFGKKIGKDGKSFGSISVIRMGIDNIPNTLSLIGPDGRVNYDEITKFSASDYAVLLSYARKIMGNINFGANSKIIYRQIGKFATAWGFGFDAGIQMKLGKVSFGLMGRDITSTFMAWSFDFTDEEKEVLAATGNEIPKSSVEYALPKIIAGVAYESGFGKNKDFSYLVEFDVNLSTDGTRHAAISSNFVAITPALGLELGYKKKVFFRAGAGNLQRVLNDINGQGSSFEFQPNIGMGLRLGRLNLDYALTNAGNLSGVLYSHIFSLSLDLVKKK